MNELTVNDSNDSNDTKDSNSKDSNLAGIIRGLLRNSLQNVASLVGRFQIGSLPTPRPKVKTVARSAAKISDLLDYHEIFQNASKLSHEDSSKSITSENIHENNNKNKIVKHHTTKYQHKINRIKILLTRGLFELTTTSILGATLFSVFERTHGYLTTLQSNGFENLNDRVIIHRYLTSSSIGLFSGLLAGCSHGLLSFGMLKVSSMLRTWRPLRFIAAPTPVQPSFIGLIISHMMIHGTLFGVYSHLCYTLCPSSTSSDKVLQPSPEVHPPVSHLSSSHLHTNHLSSSHLHSNHLSESHLHTSHSPAGNIERLIERIEIEEEEILSSMAGIITAGLFAGCASEIVAHYCSVLEEQRNLTEKTSSRLMVYSKRIREIGLPNTRSVLWASLPSALGFLTYEMAKYINLD